MRMSQALDYLLKARPQAMQAYFTFLKQAGSHLDPKTAALISVITKVHAKTSRGLKQYLPRALKAGASADEVIDALLMAMPALGFSKIVWAVDVILDMDLPEFRKYAAAGSVVGTAEWLPIAGTESIPDGQHLFVRKGNLSCHVVRSGNDFIVYDAHCPHKDNVIMDTGALDGQLTCPFHAWKFDLKTGECISGGKTPLKKLNSKIDNKQVLVQI